MNLVIVESPAKAKTINKYLGPDYHVLASFGHVRDLPSKNGSVKPDEDFAMAWQIDPDAKKRVSDIAKAAKEADNLILATDPDREGEAISWHVLEILKSRGALKGLAVKRVVFNAITKSAVLEAMRHPRDLDDELVNAYLARRALDYLVGFTLSPVLWRKLPGARSAGRVQSVALRLICDRELEIESFKSEEYWTLNADFLTPEKARFTARLVELDGKKLTKMSLGNQAATDAARAAVEQARFSAAQVEAKPAKRHPQPPFTTSTLQQEAARKLGFNASRTMRTAQKLYEGVDLGGETVGLITYMRTDGVQIAPEAVHACRTVIGEDFGKAYVPARPRAYKAKAKNAQEAHEAIRPTSLARRPKDVAGVLSAEQLRLYELIWKRTLASQMESARLERTTITARSGDGRIAFRATGSVLQFPGFLALYQEGRDDGEDNEQERRLPPVAQGAALDCAKIAPEQHFTEPPPRFSEASLVKKMEELGIGRPSTYASILDVLRDRNYVVMERNRFVPEDKGRIVIAFLENFFGRYVDFGFTAALEEKLDRVSAGEIGWKTVLRDFWNEFSAAVEETKDLRISQVLDAINDMLAPHIFPPTEDGADPRACPSCGEGRLSLKVSRYGAFIGCSRYPECKYTRKLATPSGGEDSAEINENKLLGKDPETGLEITLRAGRFGPYIQLGEGGKGEKPKRASLPKGMTPDDLDLEKAIALLSLPREIGLHPETGKPITAAIGRYGPYVLHDGKYANLPAVDEVFTIGLNRAVSVLAEAKPRGRAAARVLAELGKHPQDGEPIQVLDGRYGPYVKYKRINATLPKDKTPDEITLEEALALIAAKAAKPKRKPAKKKTTAKTTKTAKSTKKKT
jgi:DNA topoisomerase-1